MTPQRLGVALVVCAPSGAGKTTLVKRLLAEFPRFAFSVSYTTRSPRAGEVDGRDYCFVSMERFHELMETGFFVEWAEVHGNFYGTPLAASLNLLATGRDVLFDVDVQGVRQLRENLEEGRYVFILPPSREVLAQRLRGRGTDDQAAIAQRLANAAQELSQAALFDAWIVNSELEQAYAELKAFYTAATLAPRCRPGLVESILAGWRNDTHG